MFRRRLREYPSAEELAAMYAEPHDHRIYGAGHDVRVRQTVALGCWLRDLTRATSFADLSTGNAEIPAGITQLHNMVWLGDIAPGYRFEGPIEETIKEVPSCDMFILSETIEHIDFPEQLLLDISEVAKSLLLSTPIGEDDLGNPEHVWGWDQEAVGEMLRDTGWKPQMRVDVIVPDSYHYQIWACT